ncbi:MAG TPA: TraB/GumN family protein [Thermodesulfovibrionales bacterium]|nr:TraB/GumN family protein [Thermodesulfovibrionales bacterium]
MKRKCVVGWLFRLPFCCVITALLFFPFLSPEIALGYQKSFFWRVLSKSATVYVLGSLHALKKEMYPLPEKIEDAFSKSDVLVVEANINEMPLDGIMGMLAGAMYTGNEGLEDHLSKEAYELAKGKLKGVGMPIELFQKSKPWFLALVITALEMQKLGIDPEYGVDNYFLKKAAGTKRIVELESIAYQMNLLSALSEGDQESFLVYTLKDLDSFSKEMDSLIKAWGTGDAEALESIVSKGMQDDPRMRSIYEKLIYERNTTMASRIEGYLQTGSHYFVVVGAGHLAGKKGIIEILKEKGYSVEQW